jgi:hypothetical protein
MRRKPVTTRKILRVVPWDLASASEKADSINKAESAFRNLGQVVVNRVKLNENLS